MKPRDRTTAHLYSSLSAQGSLVCNKVARAVLHVTERGTGKVKLQMTSVKLFYLKIMLRMT